MEKFKSITGKDVRIASTSGHVIIVGSEFTPVPDHLVPDAMAKGLLSEAVYNEARKSIEAEMQSGQAGQQAPPQETPVVTPEEDEARKAKIIAALQHITELVNGGAETSPGGNKLMYNGKPILGAVSEFAGFAVTNADIEAALA